MSSSSKLQLQDTSRFPYVLSFASLSELSVTPVDVRRSLQNLKTGEKDVDNLSSDHLRHAATVIAESLATLFTSILRHGYMPSSIRDCTVIPIPKGLKDASCSSNYRGIAIASTLSKVLEGVILHKYSEFFTSIVTFSLVLNRVIPLHSALG